MPKILVRERDNSTAPVTASNNFSVVVPGYRNTPKAGKNINDVALGYGVYELKSQADFENYIGKYTKNYTADIATAVPPQPTLLRATVTPTEGNWLAPYVKQITLQDFEPEVIAAEGEIYKVTEIAYSANPASKYGKDGYLLYTHRVVGEGGVTEIKGTYEFTKISKAAEVEDFVVVTGTTDDPNKNYCNPANLATANADYFSAQPDGSVKFTGSIAADANETASFALEAGTYTVSIASDLADSAALSVIVNDEETEYEEAITFTLADAGNVTIKISNESDDTADYNATLSIMCAKGENELVFVPYTEPVSQPTDSFIQTTGGYCKIKPEYVGADARTETPHYGNQIAYNLLGQGYTVLFKELDPERTATSQMSEDSFWAPLKDKSIFNFRYVMAGGCYAAEVMNKIIALAEFNNDVELKQAEMLGGAVTGRGDCIALCDLDETSIDGSDTMENIVRGLGLAAKAITASTNAALFAPTVQYAGDDLMYPASYHYLLCSANARKRYAEWYAVAGYARGVSPIGVVKTSLQLGEIAINTLAPRIINNFTDRSVNLILTEKNNFYLWGNRTAATLDNTGLIFSHFLNIRQLCTSIKKAIYSACRLFTFDPNSDLLWINFVNAIKPTLEEMKADQGISDYKISKVIHKEKAVLKAKIRIIPIEAVEDFDITLSLEDSADGLVIGVGEQ